MEKRKKNSYQIYIHFHQLWIQTLQIVQLLSCDLGGKKFRAAKEKFSSNTSYSSIITKKQ